MILDLFTKPSPSLTPCPQGHLPGIHTTVQHHPPATIRDLATAAQLKQALADCEDVPTAAIEGAKSFVSRLPQVFPTPSTIEVGDDGEVTLEWYKNPRCVLLVNIGASSTISFAGLNGADRVHGKAILGDSTAEPIVAFLRNLQPGA